MGECMYCTHNEEWEKLMMPLADIDGHKLYLMKNQSYPGRCVLACRWHVKRLTELTESQAQSFMNAIYRAEKAITAVVHPDQINCALYGDLADHLHCHFAPKFIGGFDYGDPFIVDRKPGRFLDEEAAGKLIESIRGILEG